MTDFVPHPFVGRRRELELLDNMNQRPGAKFLVVYGRRRVGKTRLLMHWAHSRNVPVLYWVARQTTAANLLATFSQALYGFMHPESEPDELFTYQTWDRAFKEVTRLASEKRFVLIIDEFTYATEAVQELASVLQMYWDHFFQQSQLFLIISGSQVNMMLKQVSSAKAPLFGRATARIHLRPLAYSALPHFFPNYQPDALVAVSAILGGIPAYLEKFDADANIADNIRNVLLVPNSLIQSEALLLLHENFEEPNTYVAIMQAIAQNRRTPTEIANYTQLAVTTVGTYLKTLVDLNIVERRIPITSKPTGDVRKGRYYLQDPYLRFYFRFIAPRLDDIEAYRTERVLNYIRENLRAFVGEYAFEFLCRDWTSFTANRGDFGFYIDRVGGYWGRDAQLDVFAVDEEGKNAIIGECKWGANPVEKDVIEKLLKQAPKGVSHLTEPEKWKTRLLLFTRTGVTPEAEKLAQAHNVRIVSLEELDKDLREDV